MIKFNSFGISLHKYQFAFIIEYDMIEYMDRR